MHIYEIIFTVESTNCERIFVSSIRRDNRFVITWKTSMCYAREVSINVSMFTA